MCGSRRARLTFNVVSVAVAVVVGTLAVLHFRRAGFPLAHADVLGLVLTGTLFLVAYAFKAYGWQRLFAPEERPQPLALAAAGGAASVTGIALPGRFDDVVRIAVVRRFPGNRAGIGGVGLSLALLGLIDAAALTPLAGVTAGLGGSSNLFRIGLCVVAGAGVASAAIVLLLPRLLRIERLIRFRLTRWLHDRTTCPREASKAWILVSMSWVIRGAACLVLLSAVGVKASVPLALAYLCASAASAALPIAPGGAATQAGAGAAVLIASGVHASQAIAFSVGAQLLGIMAGAAIVAASAAWTAGSRLVPVRV
jgi:uncharacterized membrane protein YbhN (UPF0104 family)